MSAGLMVIFTIVMIVLAFFKVAVSLMVVRLDKLKSNGKTDEELKNDIALVGCVGVPFIMIYTLCQLIYYLYFLEHDWIKYPTYLMLLLFVYGICKFLFNIIKGTSHKKEKKLITKVSLKQKLTMILGFAFYIYALTVLILG